MPRAERIRFRVKKSGSSNSETYVVEEGTTYREFLVEELGVNLNKVSLLVDGSVCNDLSAEIESGDDLELQPKNYDSGC